MKCESCDSNNAKITQVVHETVVGEHVFKSRVNAIECPKCGELVAGDELARAEFEVASELVVCGIVNKESFRFLRSVLDMNGRQTAELLNVTPETVSRWESGARELEWLAWAHLAAMVRDKADGRHDTAEQLRAMRSPRTPREFTPPVIPRGPAMWRRWARVARVIEEHRRQRDLLPDERLFVRFDGRTIEVTTDATHAQPRADVD